MTGLLVFAAVIDLDVTFFAQLALFLLLFVALRPLILTPLIRLHARRREETSLREDSARKLREEADLVSQRVEAALQEARQSVADARRLAVDAAKVEAERGLDLARKTAASKAAGDMSRVRAEAEEAHKGRERAVDQVAEEIFQALAGGRS